MKKIIKAKKKKSNKLRNTGIVLFFSLVITIIAVLPNIPANRSSYGAGNTSGIQFTPVPAKNSLQLETFQLTPAPLHNAIPVQQTTQQPTMATSPIGMITPNPVTCVGYDDSGIGLPSSSSCTCPDDTVVCKNGQPYTLSGAPFTMGTNTPATGALNPCGTVAAPGSGTYCIEKPIIYLYPTSPTLVDVHISSTGNVVVSNPYYPLNGWKNILAGPNGILDYQGRQYSELFYETSVTAFKKPTSGIVIPTDQLNVQLTKILDQLGLVGREKQEFIAFWIPQLQALHSPYVYFSLLDPIEKAKIDTVDISPKPNVQIAFIAYFKPVTTNNNNSVLQLPAKPQRVGFVSVEWGGLLDK